MNFLKRRHSFTKMDKEDPEERRRRKAQFLIYKTLQKADVGRKKESSLRTRLYSLKVKIGKRVKRMKKGILVAVSVAGAYKQVMGEFLNLKGLVRGRDSMKSLSPPHPELQQY